MSFFTIFDSTGKKISSINCPDSMIEDQLSQTHFAVKTDPAFDGYYDLSQKSLKPFPSAPPTEFHNFEPSIMEWVDCRSHADIVHIEKEKRNTALLETDWTQLPDVPESIRTAYQTYRQALRDIPQQAGFPDNIVWPTKPE